MSLTARLHIKGHEHYDKGIKIISCDYGFSQDISSSGKNVSNVRAGTINITISGVDDDEIVQWMLGRDVRKNGKITFSGVVDTGPSNNLEFEDAVLISYHKSFTDESDIMISLTLSVRKITVSGATYEMKWDNANN